MAIFVVYSFSGIRCQLFESEFAWKLKVFSQRSSYILNTTSFFTVFVRGISYSCYNMQHKYHSFVFQYLFQIICQYYVFNIHLLQLNSSLSVNELGGNSFNLDKRLSWFFFKTKQYVTFKRKGNKKRHFIITF